MKMIKKIIYSLLGLLMLLTLSMVGLILYAEYSGKPFRLGDMTSLEKEITSDNESRLVYEDEEPITPSTQSAEEMTEIPADEISPSPQTDSQTPTDGETKTHVLNKESTVFHLSDCPLVANISEVNYSTMEGTRDDVIGRGYDACGECNP